MTREEFIENIQCWSELFEFCDDEGCDYCEDVYDDDQKDDYFDSDIVEMASNADGWRDLYRQLDDIPTGYDYYVRDDYDGWRGADEDDFANYKNDVLNWGDNNDIWDEIDDEEDEEYEGDEEVIEEEPMVEETLDDDDGEEEPEEGCSLSELFASCTSKLQTIEVTAEQERKQEEQKFKQFISEAV